MNEQINKTTVQNTLTNIINNIFENAQVPMGKSILSKTHNPAIRFRKNKYDIIINVSPLFENKKAPTISEQTFVDIVWSCFHEEEHLHQNYIFQQSKCTNEIRHMAHTELLHVTIPETYDSNSESNLSGYWHNINEINAELYGLKKTIIFFQENFQENFPEIDVENHIIQLIKDKTVWYADNKNIKNIHEATQKLEDAKQQSYDEPILLQIRHIHKNYSPCLKSFVSDETRRKTYVNAYDNHDGQTCMQLLLDFIKENQPWKYKKFTCLQDEWTDEIRNAKPPAFAKLRKLDRAAELEAQYGDKLDPQQPEQDNVLNLRM